MPTRRLYGGVEAECKENQQGAKTKVTSGLSPVGSGQQSPRQSDRKSARRCDEGNYGFQNGNSRSCEHGLVRVEDKPFDSRRHGKREASFCAFCKYAAQIYFALADDSIHRNVRY